MPQLLGNGSCGIANRYDDTLDVLIELKSQAPVPSAATTRPSWSKMADADEGRLAGREIVRSSHPWDGPSLLNEKSLQL
jgi:hypothetical protein